MKVLRIAAETDKYTHIYTGTHRHSYIQTKENWFSHRIGTNCHNVFKTVHHICREIDYGRHNKYCDGNSKYSSSS